MHEAPIAEKSEVGSIDLSKLPHWLHDENVRNRFIADLIANNSYRLTANQYGTTRNAISGIVVRAGGLYAFLTAAGVQNAQSIARDMQVKQKTTARIPLESLMAQLPERPPLDTKKVPKAARVRDPISIANKAAAQGREKKKVDDLIQKGEKSLARDSKTEPSEKLQAVVNSITSGRSEVSAPGVHIQRARSLAPKKAGEVVSLENPRMENSLQIMVDSTGYHMTVSLDTAFVALVKKNIESDHSSLMRAVKDANIRRISLVIVRSGKIVPIAERRI